MNIDHYRNTRGTVSDSRGDPLSWSGRGYLLTGWATGFIVGCLLVVAGFVWLCVGRFV